MKPQNLYDKLVPCLTKPAQEAYDQMRSLGFDSDLALLVLEQLAQPESIYEIPDEAEEDERSE